MEYNSKKSATTTTTLITFVLFIRLYYGPGTSDISLPSFYCHLFRMKFTNFIIIPDLKSSVFLTHTDDLEDVSYFL